ncbi:polysaccharide biosynthesis/export family protein [Gemmata sp.]|uniref:polysaccharide biosynthesis/export family protein n=1 Tax=Gemmata sp. TaxID=1914242 RepID=UPI003F70CDA9
MGKRVRLGVAFGLWVFAVTGCSTIGDTLGFSSPSYPLTKTAKEIRDTVPVPAPVARELAMELLPTHIVEPGDTLLVQPVELDAPVRLPPDQLVQPDGTIDLGQFGRPVVAGSTLAHIETQIRDIIRAKQKEPVAVTVRLLSRPGRVFYVLGEVNAPGAFPITGRDTVLSAVTQAGGLTRKASEQNIIVSRPTVPDGCRVVLPVCYTNIVQLGDTTTNYQLQSGDRVYVSSKGTLEGLLPARCQKPNAACARPQASCFGGGCATGCAAPGGAVAIPAAPPAPPAQ